LPINSCGGQSAAFLVGGLSQGVRTYLRQRYIHPEQAEAENAKPYAAYYHKPPAVIPEIVREHLLNRSHAAEDALPFENINDLLLPGYLPLENGHCRLPNSSFFVTVTLTIEDRLGHGHALCPRNN
jgi:hypothetical protein